MAAFIGGLKESLKNASDAAGVSSKLNTAKEFLHNTEASAIKSIKEKVGNVALPPSLTAFNPFNKFANSGAGCGLHQSPVNIVPAEAKFDPSIQTVAFDFCYYARDALMIKNTGSVLKIVINPLGQSALSAPGFLMDRYQLLEINCHWGSDVHNGSEHTIGGLGYAAEFHFVHLNTQYGDLTEALKHSDGLAICTILLAEGFDNHALDPLVRLLGKVPYKDDETGLDGGFDMRALIPERRDFWTYDGSLTIAPYAECVKWIVFKHTVPISIGQLNAFRTLHTVGVEDAERNPKLLQNNVRPVQALNGREIRSSFQ